MTRNRKNPAARKQEGFFLNVTMLLIKNKRKSTFFPDYLLYIRRLTPAILKWGRIRKPPRPKFSWVPV